MAPNRSSNRNRNRRRKVKPIESTADILKELRNLKLKTVPESPNGIAYPPIKVAAFNIQIFGRKKMRDRDNTHILVKILQRYDLILVLEIRDRSDTALDKLVKMCSSVDPSDPYTSVVSERLGRTNSKEQYAFLYRYSKLKIKDIYQYDDGEDNGSDVFEREPFAVRFTSPTTEIEDFAIIAIHTSPRDAVREIDGLAKVYEVTKARWNLENIIIAGDFNADEGYVNNDDWSKIALRNDRRFKWMIKDETDTMVGNTDRAYDRFVVAGKKLIKSIVPGSTGVFQFDDEFGMTTEEAEDVSDHYPIEMELNGKPNMRIQDKLETSISFTVHQTEPIGDDKFIRTIYRSDANTAESAYFSHKINRSRTRMQEVVATRKDVDDVIGTLKQFQTAFPGVLQDGTIEMVDSFLNSSTMTQPQHIYGLVGRVGNVFDIVISARLSDPMDCHVQVIKRMS